MLWGVLLLLQWGWRSASENVGNEVAIQLGRNQVKPNVSELR